jgi:large subunit ribosomal protein L4
MSAQFTLYSIEGKEVGSVPRPELFDTPVNQKLIHRYFIWVGTMLRNTLAHTKTRGEVRGGGKKPYKQKGTGRARTGSIRNPIWRTGGTVFGPRKEQTYATRMPRGERRLAMFSALSAKANIDGIRILDAWAPAAPSTKAGIQLLQNLQIADKKVLYVATEYSLATFKSVSNIPKVSAVTLSNLNIIELLNHDVLVMDQESLAALERHFTPTV